MQEAAATRQAAFETLESCVSRQAVLDSSCDLEQYVYTYNTCGPTRVNARLPMILLSFIVVASSSLV
jgi:hypothetical protein